MPTYIQDFVAKDRRGGGKARVGAPFGPIDGEMYLRNIGKIKNVHGAKNRK
jgi:hypothetical protein